MRIAKRAYSPLVLILGLGIMYSQMCAIICAVSNCSAPVTGRRAATVEHGGHCHQNRPSSQKEQPPEDQHKCPGHGSVASILPAETVSTVVSHDAWRIAATEVASS